VAGAHKANCLAGLLTFVPHPAEVLRGIPDGFYLSSPDEKNELLSALGVDFVLSLPFTKEIAGWQAITFLKMVTDAIQVRRLIVGEGFALGKGRAGTTAVLEEAGKVFNYELQIVRPYMLKGDICSSSLIRSVLALGDVEKANQLLGREYSVEGKIVHGDGRGHKIGFPTANVQLPPKRLLPANGVYVCRVTVSGGSYTGVANIGVRPTFIDQPTNPVFEIHLLDFSGDLYGSELSVSFLRRLREEKKFFSVNQLVQQIELDILEARKVSA
jgi:riboflavin kinase/FMN adenylyltransferase